jgi:hypothetical protein
MSPSYHCHQSQVTASISHYERPPSYCWGVQPLLKTLKFIAMHAYVCTSSAWLDSNANYSQQCVTKLYIICQTGLIIH